MNRSISSPLLSISLCACLLLGSSGCTAPTVGDVGAVRQIFAMDTAMQLTVYGDQREEAADAAVAEINRLEALFSRTRTNTPVYQLNASAGDGAPVAVGAEAAGLLALAKEYGQRTGGAFNVTIAPLMDAWGFTQDSFRVPDQSELDALLPLADPDGLVVDPQAGTAMLTQAGMAVDLGGVGKGYAAAQAEAVLRSYGVESALLSLGGNITAMGTRYDGQSWQVAVRDPQDQEGYLCVLSLQDVTVSTSGGYERYFESGGQTYHHILDPATGAPARSGLRSVTVVAPDAVMDDILSTALFVMGPERALDYWRAAGDFEAVLACEDGTVYVTEGLEDGLDFRGEEAGYTCEIVRR